MNLLTEGKTNWKYILIIIVLVAIVGGLFVYEYLWKTEEDETANWKTYINDKYGFEIRYPPTWYALEESASFVTEDVISIAEIATYPERPEDPVEALFENARLLINHDARFSSLNEVKSLSDSEKMWSEEGKIGELEIYREGTEISKIFGTLSLEWVYIENKIEKTVYRFDMQYNKENNEHKEALNQMLSNFRFLE